MDVSETEAAALIFPGQFLVVDAQQVQQGGLEVVYMHGVFHDVVAEGVGGSVDGTRPRSPTRHPHGKTPRVMVPAVISSGEFSLAVVGAAKFPAPNHQGVFEKASLLKVGEKAGRRLIGFTALGTDGGR